MLNDGCKELVFGEGKFLYRDRYFGENSFVGEEVVFYEEKCMWVMNYYGYIVPSEGISPKEIYKFLREALKRVDEKKPFRGPDEYEENASKYFNDAEGDVSKFYGVEKILCEGKEVYTLWYHGGLIKGET